MLAVACLAPAGLAGTATAQDESEQIRHADSPTAVEGRYIAVLKDTVSDETADTAASALAGRYGAAIQAVYTSINAFSVLMDESEAKRLAADPAVGYVEQDQFARASATTQPSPLSWGLDRIDERSNPTDDQYIYDADGTGVNAYVIDTGVRLDHADFGGRAFHRLDTVNEGDAPFCNGHGTHVAGTIGGTEYGVAKKVTLHSLRVLDCDGHGYVTDTIQAVAWVTRNHVKPAVTNMSLGGAPSSARESAIARPSGPG
ncbi:S8 family serine peptidase [Actinokineospora sp. 24-640]